MNLGRRIEKRLAEMGKRRSYLFEQVPGLLASNLSLMITRDSKRSKFDADIAIALGVRLEWLINGSLPKYVGSSQAKSELGLQVINMIEQNQLADAAVFLLSNMTQEEINQVCIFVTEMTRCLLPRCAGSD